MIRNCLVMIFFLLSWSAFSQQDPVLVRIGGKDILRSEFEYSYNKNKTLFHSKQSAPEKYMEHFVNFKLKIAAAETAGLDTALAFRERLEEYRTRLIKSYLTDEAVTEDAARRLYDKMKTCRRTGEVRVSHIFNYLPQNISNSSLRNIVARMDSIYEALRKNPADTFFDACMERFSDETQTFWVGRLQMPVEFEDVAFDLEVGEVSPPFFTPQGVHIVKVLERKEMPPFESAKEEIMSRLASRHGMDRGTAARVEKLKKEYQYVPDRAGVEELMTSGHTNRVLFTLAGRNYTGTDFSRFAMAYPAGLRRQLDAFIMKTVLDYENAHLEQKYPELHYLVKDYHDRLLFDKITEELHGRAAKDEVGLKAYFETHRSDYQWEEQRYKGIVLHGVNKRAVKQARKLLKSLPEEEWKDALRLTFNAGAQPQIQAEQGVFAPGDNAYIDDLVFKDKDAAPMVSFPFTEVLGRKVKGPEDYREVKNRLVADYQNYLDKQWTDRLRASAKVEINQEVLKTVNKH